MYQAGTLSGNPLAMAAGIATLRTLGTAGTWETLEDKGAKLVAGLQTAAATAGIPVQAARVGTMLGLFFADEPVTDWETASLADTDRFARYFEVMLNRGVYLAPSQFEAAFLSTAHGEEEIEQTISAAAAAFAAL
jgi:glutamate-1-semialdehyde 2,1-aminomutase